MRQVRVALSSAFSLAFFAATITFPALPQTPQPQQIPSNRSLGERNGRAIVSEYLSRDFDIREQDPSQAPGAAAERFQGQERTIMEQRKAAAEEFLSSAPADLGPGVRLVLSEHGLPKSFFSEQSSLRAPSREPPEKIARDFLREYNRIFPFTSSEIDNLRLTGKDVAQGAAFLSFNQTLNGIDVFRGHVKIVLNGQGQVVHAGVADVVPSLSARTNPTLRPDEAVKAALKSLGLGASAELLLLPPKPDGRTAFRNPRGDHYSDITAELSIFPIPPVSGRLAYRIFLEVDPENWFEMLIDAEDGRLLFRHNLYVQATARVWKESPIRSATCPAPGPCPRELVTLPDGWLSAAAVVTTGNNVDAFVDTGADDAPDANAGPNTLGGRGNSPTQVFDFPAPDGPTPQDPTGFKAASVTNLFYFVNTAHDYFYGLGFDEAAGNFQSDNFGRGASAKDKDPVLAAAQYGSAVGIRNNSNFAPTPDGTPARMRIYLFSKGTTNAGAYRDGAYDGQVVLHEYTHGVSTRLVGNRTDTSCLSGAQSGALGEGWSDYFAISFFNNPVFGAYSWLDNTNGIRRHSYDGYKFTYEDVGNAGFEVHNDGEIWAATLWDLRTALGQTVTDRLVMNALKVTPCRPSMIDARDAILAADQATSGGVNRAKIWPVFARHGMGFSAAGADGSLTKGTVFTAAYDQPPDLAPGTRNPAITSTPPASPGVGDTYSYRVTASEPGGASTFTYRFTAPRTDETVRGKPAGMTIDSGTGQIQWTAAFVSQRVKITVDDGTGGTVIHGFQLVVNTTLAAGVPVIVSAPRGTTGIATFTVPAGATVLQVTTRGLGDADLFIFNPDGAFGGTSQRDQTSNETVSVAAPKQGRWTILVNGFKGFQDVSLTAAVPVPALLPGNSSQTVSGDASSETFFRLAIPPGATLQRVSLSGQGGTPRLLIRRNLVPTCQFNFDFFRTGCVADYGLGAASPTIGIQGPDAGDLYVGIYGFTDYRGYTLTTELTVSPTLALSSSALTFSAVEGGAAPASQTLTISDAAGGSSFSWMAEGSTSSGGPWLQLSPTSGVGTAAVQVSVLLAGLSRGTYTGAIKVTATGLARAVQTVTVTLNITGRTALAVGASALTFSANSGRDPAPQPLAISNSGGGPLNFSITAATTSGGDWLAVNPTSGTTTTTVQVVVRAAALAGGVYRGSLTITAAGAANSPVVVAVTLTIDASAGSPVPRIASGGVVGAGLSSPSLQRISANAIISIFGDNFAPPGTVRLAGGADLVNGRLPTNFAGVCIQIGTQLAAIFHVFPGQLNVQAPSVPPGNATVQVIVGCGSVNEVRSNIQTVTVQAATPEFFYFAHNPDGRNPIAATNAQTGAYIGNGAGFVAAQPSDILTLYATGFGATNPAFSTGELPGGIGSTVSAVTVNIGGIDLAASDVLYAGVAPFLAGVYQINLRIPVSAPDGDLQVSVRVGSFSTPSGAFLTVRRQ